MNRSILLLLALFCNSCDKPREVKLARSENGNLTLSSSIIYSTFSSLPLQKPANIVLEYSRRSLLSNGFHNPDSIIPNPSSPYEELGDVVTKTMVESLINPYIIWSFLSDTCVSVFLRDTSKNENHIKACIELVSSVFGNPHHDNIDPANKRNIEGTDHYTWESSLGSVEMVHWKLNSEYFIHLYNKNTYAQYENTLFSVTPKQPL